ncbi:unnamed protein product, partial [Medioppia subpectinata]
MDRFHINDMNVILEDNKRVYQTGDYITGKLVLTLRGEILVSIIQIKMCCLAQVKWMEMPGLKSDGHQFHIKRKYVELDYQLPDEFCDKYFTNGMNEIPFMFRLPESGIPSSFESSLGSIQYFIEAFVGEPEIDENMRTETTFVVESPFKDNLYLSVGGSTEKELGIINLGSGTIRMNVSVFKKGYIPGELAEVVCNIENDSTHSATPRATLYQTQIFMTGEKHKTIETTVTEAIVGDTIEAGVVTESVINVPIPDDIPLSLKCPNITVKY